MEVNGKTLLSINIENCLDANFLIIFENEVKEKILPYLTVQGIKLKIINNPDLIYSLPLKAQEFLGIVRVR